MEELSTQEKAKAYDEAYKKVADRFGSDVADEIFTESKESYGERIRKAMISGMAALKEQGKETFATIPLNDCIDWLEKEGKQNSVNTDLDELVIQLEEAIGTSPHSRETIKDFFQKAVQKYMNCLKIATGEIGALVEENYRLKEKQGDEVEPRFKVGDYVVYNRNDSSREILYVYDIRDGRYYFNDNIHFSWSVKECDEKCHLWTIDDVKDGDVVAMEPYGTYEKPFVAVYKGRGLDHFVSYCFTSFDGKFNEGTGGHCLNVHPATKEQCEQLEKAMTEAGYTFDFDKKDLKKVEQNPAWSEEDERQFSIFIRHCYLKRNLYKKENNKEYAQTCQGLIDWLEAIKQRAELAVDNPNEKAMVKYLYEKKGYPIDLNGNLVSYEEAMESANRYINYKKEKFIEKACEWMKDNITYTHPRKGTEECVVNLEKLKDYMKGE